MLEKYKAALALPGDPRRGQKVAEATCSTCHRVGDKGNDVGPNLASVRQWSAEQILLNIVDPNREVSPNFVDYVIELTNGERSPG